MWRPQRRCRESRCAYCDDAMLAANYACHVMNFVWLKAFAIHLPQADGLLSKAIVETCSINQPWVWSGHGPHDTDSSGVCRKGERGDEERRGERHDCQASGIMIVPMMLTLIPMMMMTTKMITCAPRGYCRSNLPPTEISMKAQRPTTQNERWGWSHGDGGAFGIKCDGASIDWRQMMGE